MRRLIFGATLVVALTAGALSCGVPLAAHEIGEERFLPGDHPRPRCQAVGSIIERQATAATPPPPPVWTAPPVTGLDLLHPNLDEAGATAVLADQRIARLTIDPALQKVALGLMAMHHIPEAAVVVMDIG